jgi:hypothetical protein
MTTEQNSVRVYRPSAFLRIAGGGLAFFLGTTAFFVGGYFSLAKGVDVQGVLVSIVMGCAFLLTALYIARMQVELDCDEIRVQGALRQACIPYAQVAAIDFERKGASENMRLLNAQGKVLAKISNWLSGYPEILELLNKHIKSRERT